MVGEGHIQVVDDVQVQQAVPIGIEPRRAGAPAIVRSPRLLRDPRERAVAVVVEQDVGAVIGQEQIGESVGVVVADGTALAVAVVPAGGRQRHIFEPPVAPIPIEAADVLRLLRVRVLETAAVGQEQIQPAIAIKVDPRGAAAHDLGKKIAIRDRVVEERELDPAVAGHVDGSGAAPAVRRPPVPPLETVGAAGVVRRPPAAGPDRAAPGRNARSR